MRWHGGLRQSPCGQLSDSGYCFPDSVTGRRDLTILVEEGIASKAGSRTVS